MITNAELVCIKGNVTSAFGNEAVRYNTMYNQGLDPDFSTQQLMNIDYWILSNWQQNDDGTTDGFDNYITQAEFDEFIGFVKTYAACIS